MDNLETKTRRAVISLGENQMDILHHDGRPALVIPANIDNGYSPAVVWRPGIEQFRENSRNWRQKENGRAVAVGFVDGEPYREYKCGHTYVPVRDIPDVQKKLVGDYLQSKGVGLTGIEFNY